MPASVAPPSAWNAHASPHRSRRRAGRSSAIQSPDNSAARTAARVGRGRHRQRHLQQRGRRIPQRHAMLRDQLDPARGIARVVLGRQHKLGTGTGPAEQVVHRQVEIERRYREQAILRMHAEQRIDRIDRVERRRMRHLDTLRHARRTRRVDHVRGGLRCHRERRGQRFVPHQRRDADMRQRCIGERRVADHGLYPGRAFDQRLARGGLRDVERDIARAGGQYAEHRGHLCGPRGRLISTASP